MKIIFLIIGLIGSIFIIYSGLKLFLSHRCEVCYQHYLFCYGVIEDDDGRDLEVCRYCWEEDERLEEEFFERCL